MKKEIVSTKTLIKGKITSIVVQEYYDLHGQEIPEGTKVFDYKNLVNFEILEVEEKWIWSDGKPSIFHPWKLKVNDEDSLTEYEITGYKLIEDNHRLILRGCVGAG